MGISGCLLTPGKVKARLNYLIRLARNFVVRVIMLFDIFIIISYIYIFLTLKQWHLCLLSYVIS